MTDFKRIYAHHAEDYQRLVAAEDAEGNLLATLRGIHPFDGATVVEFGAGTGRVTALLGPYAGRIYACDRSPAMLAVAKRHTTARLAAADHRHMPLPAGLADVCIEGWAFGHFRFWNPDTWQVETDRALAEMGRLLKPGGTTILIETLGTGHKYPYPPTELIAYYAYLEGQHGFRSTWCRTDYRFATPAEAAELVAFFFGESVAAPQGLTLPECTGIWWREKPT